MFVEEIRPKNQEIQAKYNIVVFLNSMHCTAIGCARLPAPVNSWVQQDGSTALVKCNFTEETWFLVCSGRQWGGQNGNCSAGNDGGIIN